jgi:hypothetical protein
VALKKKIDESFGDGYRHRPLEKSGRASARNRAAWKKVLDESLILAQNERWRRA